MGGDGMSIQQFFQAQQRLGELLGVARFQKKVTPKVRFRERHGGVVTGKHKGVV